MEGQGGEGVEGWGEKVEVGERGILEGMEEQGGEREA